MVESPFSEAQRLVLFRLLVTGLVLLVIAVHGGRYLSIPPGFSALIVAGLILTGLSATTSQRKPARVRVR